MRYFCFLPIFIAALGTSASLNLSRLWSQKKYTPLVYFTVPPGLIPECDVMEKTVREVEKELNVHVERLDILRQPENEAVMRLLTKRTPPFLYHRESCQTVYVQPRKGGSSKKDMPIVVDKDRVRAWAKGRYLPPRAQQHSPTVKTPELQQEDEAAQEQDDLLDEMTLSPTQLKGKQAMRDRTEQRATANAVP